MGYEEEGQEVEMPSQVKSEPMSQAIAPVVEMGYEEEQYEDYSQEYGQEAGQGYDGGVLSGGAEGNKGYGRTLEELDAQINDLMRKSSNEFGQSVWECVS